MTFLSEEPGRPGEVMASEAGAESAPSESAPSEIAASALAFAALGEKKRLDVLAALAGGERCACDLTGCCGDRQPLLSFHLRKLREAGLVRARKEGRWKYYSVDREALRELAATLTRVANGEVSSSACC